MKIRISFFGIMIIFSLVITRSYLALVALAAAGIHECAHLAAAKLCRIQIEELRLDIFGAALKTKKQLSSYGSEIVLAAAGPLSNLITAAFLWVLFGVGVFKSGFLNMFFSASLFLGGLNLLPVKDFDGGRVLYCACAYCFSPDIAARVQKLFSFVTVISLWLLSVYLLLRLGASLSLFVFSGALFVKIFISEV